jgi:hypothetical protein
MTKAQSLALSTVKDTILAPLAQGQDSTNARKWKQHVIMPIDTVETCH